ncbi:hypothetical protein MLD38_015491 [Melastoma candidum]|uniref:Uncharacterized protein n=1 Tax=Melastoma candidum TaxID=119954 RepID=A0ACB9RGE4_9MYRT|nr:hypothetical protein MLD38_015491 [Melastoma candidum]
MVKVVIMEERFKILEELGQGNTGMVMLMRDKRTNELVAVKCIKRGEAINDNVEREIINHRSLKHENIIGFKEVLLTPTHLAIVMEYAAGGELHCRTYEVGLSEDEARYFFRQIISGISYCHSKEICHRDLKLENTLLDMSPNPSLKICDFGFSLCSLWHSQPKSLVGTPPYIAPEVLSDKEYDGKMADIWSCGVMLYVMLVGRYPFEDPDDLHNIHKVIQKIRNVEYSVPENKNISMECRELLSRIFIADPSKRITLAEIKSHPWFLKGLPEESATEGEEEEGPTAFSRDKQDIQSIVEIKQIIQEARKAGNGSNVKGAEEHPRKEPEIEVGKTPWWIRKEPQATIRRPKAKGRASSLS